MNKLSTKYVPLPRHAFDLQAQRQMAQAINALRNNRIVQGTGAGMVHNSDGNTVYELPAVEDNLFPFSIYQSDNNTATSAQKALFTAQGININPLTFQIRGGLIGCRPYINSPSTSTNWPIGALVGNSELDLATYCTDGLVDNYYSPASDNIGTCIILDDVNPTLICGLAAGSPFGSPLVFNAQVALNQNPTRGIGIAEPNFRGAGFWLEVVDDANNGVYINLWGSMYSAENTSTRAQWPVPSAPNIVTVGIVSTYYPGDAGSNPITSVFQIIGANLVNRYPPGSTTFRGNWTDLFAALPSGITHLWFYPGDQVVDNGNPISWGAVNVLGVYQYINPSASTEVIGQAPLSLNAAWKQIGIIND